MNVNKLLNLAGILTLIIFISLGVGGGCNNNGGSGTNGGGDDTLNGDEDLNGGGDMGTATTTLNVFNAGDATTVYAVFSSDSCTKISDWTKASSITCTSGDTTCTVTANASICSFPIGSMDTCTLPLMTGCLTSINFAFNPLVVTQPCGPTPGTGPSLAEVSINGSDCSKTPGCTTPPCDCVDISLVQGYTLPNLSMTLSDGPTTLGPTVGATGNQTVFGSSPSDAPTVLTAVDARAALTAATPRSAIWAALLTTLIYHARLLSRQGEPLR